MADNGTSRPSVRRPVSGEPGARPETNVSTQEARQGRRGAPVLYILIGGLLLAALVWAVVEFYGVSIEEPSQEVGQPNTPAEQEQPADSPSMPPAN